MIRRANSSEIPKILAITGACARHMIERGILQWNESYPNRDQFLIDLNRNELYVLEHNNGLIGCITITSLKDPEYKAVDWLTPEGNHFYIHRLAIHPDYQRQGFAHQLMDFAEQLGKQKQVSSIRLDTFSQNLGNQKFYENRGYHKLGNIFLPNQSKYPFYCYELPLTSEPTKNGL